MVRKELEEMGFKAKEIDAGIAKHPLDVAQAAAHILNIVQPLLKQQRRRRQQRRQREHEQQQH